MRYNFTWYLYIKKKKVKRKEIQLLFLGFCLCVCNTFFLPVSDKVTQKKKKALFLHYKKKIHMTQLYF